MAAPPLANLRLPPAARDAAIAELKALLGERVSTAAAVREQHAKTSPITPRCRPTWWCSRARRRR